jgi:hypothetical protein
MGHGEKCNVVPHVNVVAYEDAGSDVDVERAAEYRVLADREEVGTPTPG